LHVSVSISVSVNKHHNHYHDFMCLLALKEFKGKTWSFALPMNPIFIVIEQPKLLKYVQQQ